nr:hypothetical protein [uncultured Mucilaginibacter sp.]
MKKVLLVCAFVLGISAVSFAQGPPSPAERLAALKTSLSLNDAQVAKAKVIYDAQGKSTDSLRSAAGDNMSAMMPKYIKLVEATNAKIKAILTPEQTPIFQKQVDATNERLKQMSGN